MSRAVEMVRLSTPTPDQFNNACQELGLFVLQQASNLMGQGWTCKATSNAPESYPELVDSVINGVVPIANYGCDHTIYDDAATNIAFRFWHDVLHIKHGLSFSKDAEMTVAAHHIRAARDAGLSDLALNILNADTTGQVLYYYTHKKFVGHQKAFVYDCIRQGGLTTIHSGVTY